MLVRALSVHNVTFLGADTDELHQNWTTLGLRHLSILDTQLLDPGFVHLIRAEEYAVEAVYHLFADGADLSRLIDAAATVGARCIYMLTGGRNGLTWERAAERFCRAIEPCVQQARQAGVALAIENASSLYADIHVAHSLRDTITLAELAGLGICIDLFHCWAEADLAGLLRLALPRTELIQLSDYVLGDRALPARAVPGDGAIPIEPFVAQALAGGYRFGFDLELLGPRIDAEGRLAAAGRACATVSAMLDRLGQRSS
ncbi:xylose isomerase [Mycobacterium sp. E787]|nr:TIM barrel protein [Mycobacterium sp. E787]OBI47873.1 xylose isomerase [Mycobacterium sp. E787]